MQDLSHHKLWFKVKTYKKRVLQYNTTSRVVTFRQTRRYLLRVTDICVMYSIHCHRHWHMKSGRSTRNVNVPVRFLYDLVLNYKNVLILFKVIYENQYDIPKHFSPMETIGLIVVFINSCQNKS